MKLIITESKRESAVIKWLDNHYGNLKHKVSRDYPNLYYYMKNGEVVIDYFERHKRLCLCDEVTDFVTGMFGYSWRDGKEIISKWFQERYGYDVEVFIAPSNRTYNVWRTYSDNKD